LYEKFVRLMLMKLTTEHNIESFLLADIDIIFFRP